MSVALPSEMPARTDALGSRQFVDSAAQVWRLAWPAIGHMLLLTLVFSVDRLVLGHTDTNALASLQISSVIVWTLTTVFTAFSSGTLAIVGRAVGAGDRARATSATTISLLLALVLGVVVGMALVPCATPMVAAAFPHAGADVQRDVLRYLIIAAPMLPMTFVEAVAAAALQATGDTRTPLVAAASSNALNIVVSCTLVFGLLGAPALGVQGAAIGALCATVLQACSLLWVLYRKDAILPAREWFHALTPRSEPRSPGVPGMARSLLRVSLPAFGDKIIYAGGYLAFVAVIAWLGKTAMAANQAISSIEAICFLSAEGIGVAAGALVAQNLGRGDVRGAERLATTAAVMAVGAMSMFAALFMVAPRLLLSLFTSDASIVEAAAVPMVLAAVTQPFMAYATVMRTALRGAGATGVVLGVTLLGTLVVRFPIAYLATVHGHMGLVGIWLGCAADWIIEAATFAWILRSGAFDRAASSNRTGVPASLRIA